MKKWYELHSLSGQRAALFIYGDVVSERWLDEDVSATSFIDELQALGDVREIDLHINSPGGNVFAGIAIYTVLRSHPATITAYVDGVAASIASVIMTGADNVLISDAGMIMIHNPWAMAIGDADDLRKQADMQDKAKKSMIAAYQNRVAMTEDELSAAMDAETWYTAEEAIALGWADDVIPSAAMAASIDLSRFTNPPGKPKADPVIFSATSEVKPMAENIKTPASDGKNIETPASDGKEIASIEAAAAKKALKADQARRAEIGLIFSKFPTHSALCAECQNDLDITPDEASKRLLAKLGENAEPAHKPYKVEFVADAHEKFMVGAEKALLARAHVGKDDTGSEFRGSSLIRLAEHCLEMRGVNCRGLSKMDLVGRAFTLNAIDHSTSDFSLLLGNVANKAMLLGYDEAPEQLQWTRAINISDFKTMDMVGLSEFSDLAQVYEGGEFTHGTFSDRREQITLATYGRLFAITRQAIINDDLMAFTVIPRKMGTAAARQVGDLAWGVLTTNGDMSDGTALFHADHSNFQASGGVPTTITVDAARSAMAIQTDSSGNANLNIRPAYALVPSALFGQMSAVISSETEVAASQNNSRRPNYVRNIVREVIMDARLDTANSAGWYLAADPNVTDTVNVGYLDGVQTPFLDQQNGWTVDGAEYKVRMDAAAAAGDWRGMYYNDGVT